MRSSILQIAGLIVLLGGPVYLVWLLVGWLREFRGICRAFPSMSASVAKLQAANMDLKQKILVADRERLMLDQRLEGLRQWAEKINKRVK